MFKIKRPAIVGLLLVLLIFAGYLNYELTQQALTKTSKSYQKHEEMEKANFEKENDNILAKNEDLELVESDKDKEEDVSQVISQGNNNIDQVISQEAKDQELDRSFFVDYRLSREKLRANVVEKLDEIVKNEHTKEEVRKEAQEEIIKIGRISEKELQIEGLVKSKGYDEVVTFLTDDDIQVVVSSNKLGEDDMIKILDIVRSETDYDINNIKISKK